MTELTLGMKSDFEWMGIIEKISLANRRHAKASQGQLSVMHIPHGLTQFQAVVSILFVVLLIVLS